MADNFLIERFMDDLTPRRAIARFVEVATPADSPDPSTLFQLPQERQILPDATPAIGSSQGSQRSGLLKRKLETEEQEGANASKRSMVEIPESELLESILNDSELPSQVGSPSIVIPRHRPNDRRVSGTAFSQAIQSQESQPSTAAATAGNNSDDDSLPSELASPVLNLRRRPQKKKISESIFKKPLEGLRRKSSSDDDSDGEFPPEVPSPEVARPPSRTRSRNDSGSQYQEVLSQEVRQPSPVPEDNLIEDNASDDTVPLSDLSTDEIGAAARPQTFAGRAKTKVSMGAFNAVLNPQQVAGPTDSESLGSSLEELEDELTSQRPGERSRKRASSTLYKEVLSQKVDDKPIPSDVEFSPVRSTHSSLFGVSGDGQDNSPIPISLSSGSHKTNSPESEDDFDDASSLGVQQPELEKSKRASSSQKMSEEEANEQSSNEEEELQQKEKSVAEKQRRSGSTGRKTPLEESGANQRRSGSAGRRTPLSSKSHQESDGSLSGSSSLETPEQVKQPKTKNKPKVSSTGFKKVLEEIDITSDGEVPPQKEKSAANSRRSGSTGRRTPSSSKSHQESDGSLSGPSTLETPEQVQQPKTKSKPKISSTPFDKVLEEKATSSDEEVPPQKEKSAADPRQRGSSGRKTPLSNKSHQESDGSLSGPSTIETPELVKLPVSKNTRSKVSNAEFLKLLGEKTVTRDEEVPTQQEKSGAKARQSRSSGRKTPPSNKSSESDSSLPSSPEPPKGGASSNRTPAKSPATNGASGRKSIPETPGFSNTTGPLKASGRRESQRQQDSRASSRQSGSSGRKTPPSDKSSDSDSSLPSSPEQPKGGASSKRTPAKSPAITIGASGRKSVPETPGFSNTTAPPLEASGRRESQRQQDSRASSRQSGSSGRKTPLFNKTHESDSSLPSSPEEVKQPKQKVSEEKAVDSDDELLLSPQKRNSAASNRPSGSTGRKTPLSNKGQESDSSSSVDSPKKVEQPTTRKSTRMSSAQVQKVLEEKEPEVVEEVAIPQEASAASKRKTGSTGRRTPLPEADSSLSGPSSLNTPEQVEQPKAKKSRRVASSQFHQALEEKAKEPEVATESDANKSDKSFHGWSPKGPQVVQETLLQKSRTSSTQPEASSTSSRESAPSSKTVSTNRSTFKRVYATDAANLDDSIDSPSTTNKSTGFVPLASSTQVPKKGLEEDSEEEEEEEESVAQTVNITQKSPPAGEVSDAVSLSSSSLAELESPPKLAPIPRRSERSSAKKNLSMRDYLAALGPRHTPPKANTFTQADGVSPKRTPAKLPATNGASGRKSVPQTAAPPLEASGKEESQQHEKSRAKARQGGSSGRKSPPSDEGSESDSSLPSPPKQPKGASGRKSVPQAAGPSYTTAPPLEAPGKQESLSVSNRSRRSLKFDPENPRIQNIISKIGYLEDDPEDVDAGPPSPDDDSDVVEETPSTGEEDSVEEEEEEKVEVRFEEEELPVVDYGVEDMEEGDENDPVAATPLPASGSNRSSKKSSVSTPATQRFNIKNSTVIADGGIPFSGGALTMSPISAGSGSAVPTVQSTPSSTPPRGNKKPIRSVDQSPMFMTVMQKALTKQKTSTPATSGRTTPENDPVQPPSSEISPERVSPVEKPIESIKPKTVAPIPSTSGKGASRANPSKGKSVLTLPVVEEAEDDDSDSEWEDEPVSTFDPSILFKVASRPIVDRTKDFVPLEQRLKADPLFQAKVKFQRDKNAAEKAAADAAAAKKKLVTPKKTRAPKKKVDDNITNAATNKANLKFYAGTKVTKEALDSIHDLVGEWFDFTLDQLELFLEDEGKDSLETWEDCAKMLKRQGIAKNQMEYSGLIREVMTYDESEDLLPSSFPPGHEEAKLEAKRKLTKK